MKLAMFDIQFSPFLRLRKYENCDHKLNKLAVVTKVYQMYVGNMLYSVFFRFHTFPSIFSSQSLFPILEKLKN